MQNSFPLLKKLFLACVISLLSFTTLNAATPVVHSSPKPTWLSVCKPYDKKPSLRTVEGGYFFELVEHQIQVEKQADYHHSIREIVSQAGIQNGSQISVSFDPTFERVDFHEITVWRDNKPQDRLDVSAFKVLADEKDLSNFIYQGTYTALMILSDIRKGDRIEYSYTITGRNPIFHSKYCDFLYLQWYQTVAHQYTSLIFSRGRKLNVKAFNGLSNPHISTSNGLNDYEWEDFQVKPAIDDDSAPSWFDARAYVQVSEFDSWKEVTDWALSINPPKINIRGELATQIAKLKSASGGDTLKYFRSAVKTVQDEVRYMGIEIGQYSHRANGPDKVFSQRYGDCKDKSLLLASMLRAGGIDADMVLVNSNQGDLGRFLPAHNVFDHAVVVARLNGKQVWVDATIGYQRGTGTDIYFPDYGKALILKPGNTGLTVIPVPQTGKTLCQEIFTIKDGKSPVNFEVKTTYTLNQADRIRNSLATNGMAETEKDYLDYYAKTYAKIESKDSIVVTDDEQKNVLTTIEKYKISDFFKKDSTSGKYSVYFYADFIKSEFPSVTNQTKTPVDVSFPFNEDYTIMAIMPSGWNVEPEHHDIKRDAYRFASDYSVVGDTLSLNYQFAYLKEYVPVDKLDEFKKDMKQMNDGYLSYGIDIPATGADSSNPSLNQWTLNLALFIVLLAGVAGLLIYRKETPGIVFEYGSTFVPIGGWLILVALGLILTPVLGIISLANGNYFNINTWNNFSTYSYGTSLKAHWIFEIAGYVIIVCFALFCLLLFFKRRDILPRYIIGYFIFCLLFHVVNYIFIALVTHYKIPSKYPENMVRSVIIAAIWVSYFLKSSRVKETFIVPYPSYNFRYEPPPQAVNDTALPDSY